MCIYIYIYIYIYISCAKEAHANAELRAEEMADQLLRLPECFGPKHGCCLFNVVQWDHNYIHNPDSRNLSNDVQVVREQ